MAKVAAILCLIFLVEAIAIRDGGNGVFRRLHQSQASASSGVSFNSMGGSSFVTTASASASLTGPGTVAAHASATAETLTSVKNTCVRVVNAAIAKAEGGGDAVALARVAAEAYGKAVAEAYAAVAIDISSTSEDGAACAAAFSSAEATATAYARILVDVVAAASNRYSFSSASGAADAISSATASAFAQADATACGEGVFDANTISAALATSIARPYSIVIAEALAAVSADSGVAIVDVTINNGVLEANTVDTITIGSGSGPVTGGGSATGDAQTTPGTSCPFPLRNC